MNKLFTLLVFCSFLTSATAIASNKGPSDEKAPKVGTLTAYYAAEGFEMNGTNYRKEQLIWDTNNFICKIEETDDSNYKYIDGNGCEVDCEHLLPKTKVYKNCYEMNELTIDNVGKKAVFKSKDGLTARIFLSEINGQKYYTYGGEKIIEEAMKKMQQCYVLSFEMMAFDSDEVFLFEEQLETKNGCLKLYIKGDNEEIRQYGIYGCIDDIWLNPEDWDYKKSAFSNDGLLLTEQWQNVDIPESVSVAYIAKIDALYLQGKLYYRVK